MIAMLAYSTSAAAVCPDGNDDVGGATSSWGTDGLGLLTATVAARNEQTSMNNPAARNPIACQRRPIASAMPTTTAMPMTTKVDPSIDPKAVALFSASVRCATNHVEIERSQAPTPSGSSSATKRRPRPMRTDAITTQPRNVVAAHARTGPWNRCPKRAAGPCGLWIEDGSGLGVVRRPVELRAMRDVVHAPPVSRSKAQG